MVTHSTYSITAGNNDGLFAMDSSSGAITVDKLRWIMRRPPTHSLTVKAADAALSATATVTVNVTDVNEVPSYQRLDLHDCGECLGGGCGRVPRPGRMWMMTH